MIKIIWSLHDSTWDILLRNMLHLFDLRENLNFRLLDFELFCLYLQFFQIGELLSCLTSLCESLFDLINHFLLSFSKVKDRFALRVRTEGFNHAKQFKRDFYIINLFSFSQVHSLSTWPFFTHTLYWTCVIFTFSVNSTLVLPMLTVDLTLIKASYGLIGLGIWILSKLSLLDKTSFLSMVWFFLTSLLQHSLSKLVQNKYEQKLKLICIEKTLKRSCVQKKKKVFFHVNWYCLLDLYEV